MVIIKMLDKMEPKEKRLLQGVALILIGTTIVAITLIPLLYMMGLPIIPGTVRTLNYWILGMAFIITGIFTLKPRRTRKGIIVVGTISTIIGGILILSTMYIIVGLVVRFWGTSSIYVFWIDIPNLATLMISGTVLLLHGLTLIMTKQKNMKLIWGVIYASIGITIVVWVSRPLYTSIISSTLNPFFYTAINLNLIIVGISSLLIGFFYFNPPEKIRIKLLIGMISIIFGSILVISSLFGILSFNLYLEELESEGSVASVLNLNSIFVVFIIVGVGLIIHGVFMIKKNLDMSLITLIKKKKKLMILISVVLSLITFFTIFLGFSLVAPKQTITSSQSLININSFEWNKTWGGYEDEEVSGLALDSSGNIFITGTIGIYRGEGKDNVFLLKFDSDGNLLWAKTWGQSDYDYGYRIAIDSNGNAFITGNTYNSGEAYSDVFIRKYDSDGNILWAKIWGGSDAEWAPEIALDTSGNAFVVGSTDSYGAGSSDVFILKLDSSGNKLWDKTWGGSERDLGFGVVLDNSGNAFVTGGTSSFGTGADDLLLLKYNSTGTLLWNKTWGGARNEYVRGIVLDISGNITLTGETFSYGAGPSDVFVLKYDSSGNLLWDKTWGGSSGESGREISVDALGYAYITGETSSYGAGFCDAFILKYDSFGNLLWDITWGGSANDYGRGIALDASGNTYITGLTLSYGAGYSDVFYVKCNSSGNMLWAETWGGSAPDFVTGIVLDSSGNIFITGDIGNYGEESDCDVFLLKYQLDTDSDGLSDYKENITYFTNANNSDTDGDGLSDGWEVNYGLNPKWSSDALFDGDSDGLTNHEEYQYKADPTNPDTDGDELSDGDEVNKYHTDPTDFDTDGDRYSDGQEIEMGTDPLSSLSNLSSTLTIIIVIALSVGLTSLILMSKYGKKVKNIKGE